MARRLHSSAPAASFATICTSASYARALNTNPYSSSSSSSLSSYEAQGAGLCLERCTAMSDGFLPEGIISNRLLGGVVRHTCTANGLAWIESGLVRHRGEGLRVPKSPRRKGEGLRWQSVAGKQQGKGNGTTRHSLALQVENRKGLFASLPNSVPRGTGRMRALHDDRCIESPDQMAS